MVATSQKTPMSAVSCDQNEGTVEFGIYTVKNEVTVVDDPLLETLKEIMSRFPRDPVSSPLETEIFNETIEQRSANTEQYFNVILRNLSILSGDIDVVSRAAKSAADNAASLASSTSRETPRTISLAATSESYDSMLICAKKLARSLISTATNRGVLAKLSDGHIERLSALAGYEKVAAAAAKRAASTH